MSNQDAILFTDIFDCKDIDRDGKKFDRVSRLSARSENYDMGLLLDYNVELYPMKIGDKFSLVLASTLSLSGQDAARSQTGKQDTWRPNVTEKTLADDYDYVMYGKIYRYDDSASSRVSVLISFGGLLMCLDGEYRYLNNLVVGEYVYLLMRK